jgi:CubicO group peptidase (beta-lactamase class C family)
VRRAALLQDLLEEGVAGGVFPCAAAAVLLEGRRVFTGAAGGATARTVFDLASLTKPLATTAVFLTLWRDRVLDPETPVDRFLPDVAWRRRGLTVADLLAHRAGLPGFVPLFAPVLAASPGLLAPDCAASARTAARAAVVARALAVMPEAGPRARAVYSDLGFVLLGELFAAAARLPLDVAFVERVAAPLGVGARFHRLSAGPPPAADAVAPTGRTRPREPAPGQEGLWAPLPGVAARPGEVDDDNAWTMDGVAGHAGLFGTADDVAALGQAVLEDWAGAGRLAPLGPWAVAVRRDPVTPGSTRALGWDTRLPGDAPDASSAGRLLGDRGPGAIGHTGFTGTSLWIDLGRRLVVALCTNRTAGPRGRADERIRQFRPRFHDAAVQACGLG